MRVTSAKAFGSGTHVTDLADLATGDEPMLSDVLAAQRQVISRGAELVPMLASKEPSIHDLRELHDEMLARRKDGLTEEWEALARAKTAGRTPLLLDRTPEKVTDNYFMCVPAYSCMPHPCVRGACIYITHASSLLSCVLSLAQVRGGERG